MERYIALDVHAASCTLAVNPLLDRIDFFGALERAIQRLAGVRGARSGRNPGHG